MAQSRRATSATAAAGERGENGAVPAIRYKPASVLVDPDLTALGRQSVPEAPQLFNANVTGATASAATAARQRINPANRQAQAMAMDSTA